MPLLRGRHQIPPAADSSPTRCPTKTNAVEVLPRIINISVTSSPRCPLWYARPTCPCFELPTMEPPSEHGRLSLFPYVRRSTLTIPPTLGTRCARVPKSAFRRQTVSTRTCFPLNVPSGLGRIW